MTDRIYALTVLLEEDTREDETQLIIEAIRMIKRVVTVSPHVEEQELWAAEERARMDLTRQLWHVLYPDRAWKAQPGSAGWSYYKSGGL